MSLTPILSFPHEGGRDALFDGLFQRFPSLYSTAAARGRFDARTQVLGRIEHERAAAFALFKQLKPRKVQQIRARRLQCDPVRAPMAFHRITMAGVFERVTQERHLAMVELIREPRRVTQQAFGRMLLGGLAGKIFVQCLDGALDD